MSEEPKTTAENYPSQSKLLTKIEAAKALGLSEYAITVAVKNGALKKCEQLGIKTWYFTQTHLQDFIQRLSRGDA